MNKNQQIYFTFLILLFGLYSCKDVKDSIFKDSDIILSSDKINFKSLKDYDYYKDDDRFNKVNEVEGYSIKYLSHGLKIHGYMYKPKKVSKPLPLIIYCRGGNRDFGELTDEWGFYFIELVRHGYVVLASNYGGSSKSEGVDQFGGRELRDVIRLFDIANDFDFIDTSNVLLFGVSRGGMMVCQLLKHQRNNPNIKAAVLESSPSDLELGHKFRPEMENVLRFLAPNYEENKQEIIRSRSVVHWIDSLPPVPLLLLHAKNDNRVHVEEAILLDSLLTEVNHPHKFVLFDEGGHDLYSVFDSVIYERELWFNKYIDK